MFCLHATCVTVCAHAVGAGLSLGSGSFGCTLAGTGVLEVASLFVVALATAGRYVIVEPQL